MARINVYTYGDPEAYDPDYEGPTLAGWFNPDSSAEYKEDTEWDGNNHISVNAVGPYGHQILYRTKGGRWVLHFWSQWQGVSEKYEFVNDATAKDWLLRNAHDEAVKQHFGELEEESGPNLGGRPAVGPKVETRLEKDVLEQVDARAAKEGVSRAEMLRRLVIAGL